MGTGMEFQPKLTEIVRFFLLVVIPRRLMMFAYLQQISRLSGGRSGYWFASASLFPRFMRSKKHPFIL